MIRTLALALVLAVPAAAAPVFTRTPMEVQSVYLDPYTPGLSRDMVLAREELDVQIAGPVARVVVRQLWRYDGSWQSPGDEASQQVRASHLSALNDYWITENGAVIPGRVRDLRSAKAAYEKNLEQRRDPGLVEWIDEGVYQVRLYPVPMNGGTKEQGFTLTQVLPVYGDEITLRWQLPLHAVERGTVKIRGVNGTRITGASANVALSGDQTVIRGEYARLATGRKALEIKLTTDDVARRRGDLSWYGESGERFLQMTGGSRFVACLAGNGREESTARFLDLHRATAGDVRIPDLWLARLATSAQALRLALDADRHAEAMGALAGVRQVGPGVVLYADPAQTAAQIEAAWDAAVKDANCAPDAPAKPGFLSQLDFQVPETGIFVPNFKASRERSNGRACFANQKTLIGAIEMFNLDKNVKVEPALLAVRGQPLAALSAPPAGVEVSYWRGRSRWAPESLAELIGRSEKQSEVSGPPQAVPLPAWLFKELKDGGYLQSIPQDPGFGPGSEHNYWLTSTGSGIACLNHGFIEEIGRIPAREQFRQMGYSGSVVAAANPNMVYSSSPRRSATSTGWVFVLGMTTLIVALLYVLIGLSVPAARTTSRIGECLGGFATSLLWTLPAAILGPLLLVPLFWAAVRLGQAVGALGALVMAGESHG